MLRGWWTAHGPDHDRRRFHADDRARMMRRTSGRHSRPDARVAMTTSTAPRSRNSAMTDRSEVADPVASFATPMRYGPRNPARLPADARDGRSHLPTSRLRAHAPESRTPKRSPARPAACQSFLRSHSRGWCNHHGPATFQCAHAVLEGWQNGYCTGLENRRPQGHQGSNPWPSASQTSIPARLISRTQPRRGFWRACKFAPRRPMRADRIAATVAANISQPHECRV